MPSYANEVGRSSAAATASDTPQSQPAAPGKRTLTEQLPPNDPSYQRLLQVIARAGTRLVDGGQFGYVVTPDGGFQITHAPPPYERSVHAVITMTGRYATAWATLAALLDTTGGNEQCVEPAPEEGQSVEPAPSPSPDEGMSIGGPAPSAPSAPAPVERDGHAGTPPPALDMRGLFWVATTTCKQRDERGRETGPALPLGTHVRVIATKRVSSKWEIAHVERVDTRGASIEDLGWVSYNHLFALSRPARPSTASAQMAALLSAARSMHGKIQKKCYAFVKKYILAAGGYGDVLDVQTDERFLGFRESAVHFHDAAMAVGPATLGLELVSGLPSSAPAGTILILRGNGKMKISQEHGDISVIDGVKGSVIHAYNDGLLTLSAADETWTSGTYAGALVAMYRPIDRP